MSAIYKLSIQGIRSFDSNDRETIEFGRPLTLIVGSNGSGKTTIIECLKYATSGDLPPNSKGGAFVHDPKITGEKDVRAQVKLAFTSANSLNMIVTRNIQLLVKKTTTTFKTLEGQLVIVNNNGDRNTLSTRSVELDTQVPLYMGVPKAILEYVIFCHQEDSLWPLSEPSNLKKKFDEIFQAMKFTKALDNLKGIKKDMSLDIKLLKQSVEHLKVDRDRSEITKLKISQLNAKIEKYNSEVREIEKQISLVTERSDKLFKTNQDFQKTLSRVESLTHNRNSAREQITRLSNGIDIIDLPREQLENLFKNFASSHEEKESGIEELRRDIESKKIKSADLQNQSNVLLRRQGELNGAKDAHQKNLQSFEELLQILSSKYLISYEENSSNSFLEQLESVKNKSKMKLQNFSEKNKINLDILGEKLSDFRHSVIIQNERLDYTKMDEKKLVSEVERLDTDLQLSEFSEEDLEKEKDALDKFTKKLNNWDKSDDVSKINLQMKTKNDEMVILETELEKIQEKISKTNQQADLFAKLSIVKKLTKEKNKELSYLKATFEETESELNWGISVDSNIDIEFKRLKTRLEENYFLKEKEYHEADLKYNEASLNYNNLEKEIRQNEEKRIVLGKKLEDSLPEDCPIEDYDDVVAETEDSYRTALENLKMHQTTLAFNRKAIQIAEHESVCYLCSRKFESDGFKSSLLSILKAKTDANFENTLKKTVESEKEYLSKLRCLEKDIISFNTCNERLKILQESKLEIKQKMESLKETKNSLFNDSSNLKKDLETAEKELRGVVEGIARSKKELKEFQNEVKVISDELAIYGSFKDDIQTVDELQLYLKEKNELLRRLRKDINQLQDEKESKSREYSSLISLIKERSLRVKEIEKELSLSKNIETDINSKKEQIAYMRTSINKIEKEVEEAKGNIAALEVEESEKRKEFESTVISMGSDLKNIEDHTVSFIRMKQDIDSFVSKGQEELRICTKKLADCQEELAAINDSIEKKSAELSEESQKVKDSTNQKRNLEQNLELLDLRASLIKFEEEISQINITNAEAERERYQEESLRLRGEYEKLSSTNAGRMGEIIQLQNQIESLSQQLLTEYKDVDNHYHKKWVELQTRTFVTDDIDTYSKALDTAIMKYHGLKMHDINRIVDELWKRTYSGTDVDTIQIKSDEVSSGVRGKSYNYRVVMYKQDAELDMRGRCSAGQKVLASIIIRLALSETFGVNCGVIALDEPTTNLDEENIESLAKSLSNIIKLRRHQKNFQLIVITHDEKFLNYMDASQFTDHFFRVKRDDRQKSQIEWVDISRVVD